LKRSGGKPHSECRMVPLYQSAPRFWVRAGRPVDEGQQQIVGVEGPERAGARGTPARRKRRNVGRPSKELQAAEIQRGGREGDGAVRSLTRAASAISGAEVGLMDDARLAVDAGAFDDVVVELVAFLLGDEGSPYRVIHLYASAAGSQCPMQTFLHTLSHLG